MPSRKKVLIVGDVIVDKYVYVTTERDCSEADLPVWDVQRVEYRLGGAGNVARNLISIQHDELEVHLAGLCDLKTFKQVMDSGLDTRLLTITDYSITKERIVQSGDHTLRSALIARVDDRKSWGEPYESRFESYMLEVNRNDYDAIIISDYRMGTISEKVAKFFCENPPCPVIVDSKRSDLSCFRGATVLKLNADEHGAQLSNRDYIVESLAKFTLVTRGKDGCSVITYEPVSGRHIERPTYVTRLINLPTEKVDVVDVTGCGDTFTAAVTYHLTTKNDDVYMAARLGNLCASRVVQKFGTST